MEEPAGGWGTPHPEVLEAIAREDLSGDRVDFVEPQPVYAEGDRISFQQWLEKGFCFLEDVLEQVGAIERGNILEMQGVYLC